MDAIKRKLTTLAIDIIERKTLYENTHEIQSKLDLSQVR